MISAQLTVEISDTPHCNSKSTKALRTLGRRLIRNETDASLRRRKRLFSRCTTDFENSVQGLTQPLWSRIGRLLRES
jgi:hypothetical protein